jgi:hypothetical protein
MERNTQNMKAQIIRAKLDTKQNATSANRRFRNILANSGLVMESGEIRPLDDLYVMGYDGELYRIADLNQDPDKQTERYSVKAQADHGELKIGPNGEAELVPSIEKQFGDCRVWIDKDGLRARMYFANDDSLADHAWAISEGASYSIGFDWYEDGYYGTGYDIDQPIGILREISMVLTGNDPRAKTIDHKPEAKGQRAADGSGTSTNKENQEMAIDQLTPDENAAIKRELSEVVDSFTADVPENATEPTARDAKDEGETEAPAEEATKDALRSPVIIIKDSVKQETAKQYSDWRISAAAKRAFADLAGRYGKFDAAFKSAWASELAAHKATKTDGITGLALPVDINTLFINAINEGNSDSARILSHFRNLGGNGYQINLIEAGEGEAGRAHGHKKGETKLNQTLTDTIRSVYNKMVYKKLDLDALEVKENPEILDIRAQELVDAIIVEIARASVIGDGRTSGTPDYRMFDGTRGFYSILGDATAASGIGTKLATSLTVTGNLYDASVEAESAIDAEGGLVFVAKKSAIKAFRQAKKTNGDYVVAPGNRIEDILGATAVYAPKWMDNATCDVIVFANQSYGLTGESTPRTYTDFDLSNNTNVMLAEQARGGSLIKSAAAVALTITAEAGE